MKPYHIEIVTPDGLAYDGMVESLLVHTDDGDMEILAGHADLLATLAVGRTRIREADGTNKFASTAGGFLTVRGGEVRMVATTFEFAEEIDLKRAEEAKARAEAALSTARDDREERIVRAKLMRAASRIKVASTK